MDLPVAWQSVQDGGQKEPLANIWLSRDGPIAHRRCQQPGVSLLVAVIGCGDWRVEFGSPKHGIVLPVIFQAVQVISIA